MKRKLKKYSEFRRSRTKINRNRLKRIIKNKSTMKRRVYKINEKVLMSNGEYKKMDTKIVFTMTKEEALRTGFIRYKK